MRNKWDKNSIAAEAIKYNTRTEFQKGSRGAEKAARRLRIIDEVCCHMPSKKELISGQNSVVFKWSFEKLRNEALKYNRRSDFQKGSESAYQIAVKNRILEQICGHMSVYTKKGKQNPRYKWSDEELKNEALKYSMRQEFRENSYGAYLACKRRKILDKVCGHMKEHLYSFQETLLLNEIRKQFPSAKKFKKMNINIKNRSFIKGFEIDIYVPELNKGIEFDGTYWHSFAGLKKLRPHWSKNAIKNYHEIKDEYFRSIGIDILHVKEYDWINDKENCINLCLSFLKGNNKNG